MMPAKGPLITVVEGIEDSLERLHQFEKPPLDRDYDPKTMNNLMPTSFSASDDSELEDSDSDSELQKLDLLDDDDDGAAEDEATVKTSTEKKDVEGFRGRPSSCVFVASLAASLTDDELSISVTKHFEQWGELALVKVLRDPANRPYAFVQYTNDKDAKFALTKAQHTTLNGRTIRCEAAKVNRTLYIATCNGYEIPLKEIKETLQSYGEIEQMVGNNDSTYRKSNLNKAWFAQFAYRDDAIRAYANLRLSPEWIVEWAQNIEHPSEGAEAMDDEVEIDKCSIFVGQLDSKVTKELLNERFSKHGKILEIVLVLRPGNNFAFVKFSTEMAAAAAVERENHAVFMEKTMHVQYRELHHKKKKFSAHTPRLSLAPPPVNLPVRRASTGSGFHTDLHRAPMGHFGNPQLNRSASVSNKPGSSKTNVIRAVSFSNDRSNRVYSYVDPDFTKNFGTPSRTEEAHITSNDKQTPLSSPSNHTLNSSSNGEAKSVFSATTVSASEHIMDDSNNPTHGAYVSKHPMRRSLSHATPQNSALVHPHPPPSSYYYYAYPPKDNLVYDQPAYPLPYSSYPYYYPESSMVEFPQVPAPLSSNNAVPPAPYYMYYGVPQTPTFTDSKQPPAAEENRFDTAGPVGSNKGEIDY